ncbi:hypothetical protein K6119_02055 [Paracrocinitomix mangrovi]|uniref:hypothetical protein n=1 Tax=Paracrocinitomix mangrovi TaxID=2862509 RepID=UPI001C8ED883|nr:hypothetical protein [Paracrocinitomix mangrovi]UKN02302.1 hypothetical protein K6119_02055 [Paracrocinitomix mangrovi]
MKPDKNDQCSLCEREKELSFHHLIPKKMHKKKQVIKAFSDIDFDHYGIWVCTDCHKEVHRLFDHEVLAYHLNTLKKLKENEEMQKFVKWVSRQDKKVKR